MAQNRPDKPQITLPDNFGGIQEPFSSSLVESGYEQGIPQIIEGGNLNWMLNGFFQNTKYMRTVLDYVRDTPIGKMFWVNQQGQMDYVEPAIIATDNEFSTGTATDKTPNVKQVVDKFATKALDNAVVHLAGAETITGNKTFSGLVKLTGSTGSPQSGLFISSDKTNYAISVQNTSCTKGTAPDSVKYAGIDFYGTKMDSYMDRLGYIECVYDIDKTTHLKIGPYLANNASDTSNRGIDIVYPATGNPYAACIGSDVNGSIVTTVNKSKAQNGYFQLGNGLIVQWGRIKLTVSTAKPITTISLPIAFTSTNFVFLSTFENNTSSVPSSTDDVTFVTTSYAVRQVKGFGFDAGGNGYETYMRWVAIGY